MDFSEQIYNLSQRAKRIVEHLKTEEATKQALVIPFIQVMGFDPFDPTEVTPEYIADFGTKKGEKVDYAISINGKPTILIECKWSGVDLCDPHKEQLYRYFSVSHARVGILTNGIVYKFYTDLEKQNQLDTRPFLEFNLVEVQDELIVELRKLSKSKFDPNALPSIASELKYTREIKQHIGAQFVEPSDDFVKMFASKVYSGHLRQNVLDQFKAITQRAFKQFLSEEIGKRLKTVMNDVNYAEEFEEVAENNDAVKEDGVKNIVTTQEEVDAYEKVKIILNDSGISSDRVFIRDALSYCSVLLDNNNRRPIVRFYFDRKQKKVGLFEKDEQEMVNIDSIEDLHGLSSKLIMAANKYK